MPIVAGTQHAPFPPSGGNAYTMSMVEAAAAADLVSFSATKYDGTIKVSGQNMINGHGQTVQLRGTDFEGCVQGSYFNLNGGIWGYAQPSSTAGCNLTNFDAWKFNCVRLGFNEATWLNYTTYAEAPDSRAVWTTPDPYGFKAAITSYIATLNAHGYYVIIVLGWSMAGRCACGDQLQHMANQDNSLTFWKSVADYFGFPGGSQLKRNGGTIDNQSIMFELSNEPQYYENDSLVMAGGIEGNGFYYRSASGTAYLCNPYLINAPSGTFTQGETVTSGTHTGTLVSAYQNVEPLSPNNGQWTLYCSAAFGSGLTAGATITGATSGATAVVQKNGYNIAGHKDLIRAVRASVGVGTVGCGTPCLLSTSSYNQWLAGFVAAATSAGVNDNTAPANWVATYGAWTPQIALTWHPYPYVTYISAVAIANAGTGYQCVNSTASGGSTVTLIDSSQTWTPHQWKNAMCYNATNNTYSRVQDNTINTLTFYSTTTAVAAGNTYTLGDCINLPMDETGGPNSNSVYWQAQLYVTSVGAGGALTGVALSPCRYGQPGGNAGADTGFTVGPAGPNSMGGTYLNLLLPANPVAQSGPGGSTTGVGTGATFNLTFPGPHQSGWPDQPVWSQVLTIKSTFNTVGIPIIITETAEHGSNYPTQGSPWMAAITSWADTNGVSLFAFTYNPVPGWYNPLGQDNVLNNGTDAPLNYNPGYGQFVYNWTTTHAP